MRRRSRQLENLLTLGGRVPASVGFLIALVVLTSLAGAIAAQAGANFLPWLVLAPAEVAQGQVWRLLTWALFDLQPLNLIFAALMLFWFGRDLAFAWGPRRFIVTYFGFALATGAATTALALLVPAVGLNLYFGIWPIIDALVVAWALLNPDRQIMFWFVLPVSGRALLYITIGLTFGYAIFQGFRPMVPHLLAESMMLLWAQGLPVRRLLQRYRLWTFERRAGRRSRHLKVIGKRGDGAPPTWLN